MTLLAEIMTSPSFGEVMFLVALIIFVIEALVLLFKPANSPIPSTFLTVVGLACMSLGWLALTTGD